MKNYLKNTIIFIGSLFFASCAIYNEPSVDIDLRQKYSNLEKLHTSDFSFNLENIYQYNLQNQWKINNIEYEIIDSKTIYNGVKRNKVSYIHKNKYKIVKNFLSYKDKEYTLIEEVKYNLPKLIYSDIEISEHTLANKKIEKHVYFESVYFIHEYHNYKNYGTYKLDNIDNWKFYQNNWNLLQKDKSDTIIIDFYKNTDRLKNVKTSKFSYQIKYNKKGYLDELYLIDDDNKIIENYAFKYFLFDDNDNWKKCEITNTINSKKIEMQRNISYKESFLARKNLYERENAAYESKFIKEIDNDLYTRGDQLAMVLKQKIDSDEKVNEVEPNLIKLIEDYKIKDIVFKYFDIYPADLNHQYTIIKNEYLSEVGIQFKKDKIDYIIPFIFRKNINDNWQLSEIDSRFLSEVEFDRYKIQSYSIYNKLQQVKKVKDIKHSYKRIDKKYLSQLNIVVEINNPFKLEIKKIQFIEDLIINTEDKNCYKLNKNQGDIHTLTIDLKPGEKKDVELSFTNYLPQTNNDDIFVLTDKDIDLEPLTLYDSINNKLKISPKIKIVFESDLVLDTKSADSANLINALCD
jgi:hypothetical protein